MDKIDFARRTADPGRRAFLGFTAAGLAVPLGAMAPASWRTGRPSVCSIRWVIRHLPRGGGHGCRRAGRHAARNQDVWNSNAVCTVGVPVAEQRGYFAKRNLKVEKINLSGATDQLLEALASGKADAGAGMALGLAETAGTGLRREADGGNPWRLHPSADQPAVRNHRHCRAEGQDGWDVQYGEPGQESSCRSWRPSAASIRSRISSGASTPPICSASHCRRARSRHSQVTIRSPRSSATATIWWR